HGDSITGPPILEKLVRAALARHSGRAVRIATTELSAERNVREERDLSRSADKRPRIDERCAECILVHPSHDLRARGSGLIEDDQKVFVALSDLRDRRPLRNTGDDGANGR